MAECEDRRELEGEEEEETRGSKEHNGGAGFFRLCHLGGNTIHVLGMNKRLRG